MNAANTETVKIWSVTDEDPHTLVFCEEQCEEQCEGVTVPWWLLQSETRWWCLGRVIQVIRINLLFKLMINETRAFYKLNPPGVLRTNEKSWTRVSPELLQLKRNESLSSISCPAPEGPPSPLRVNEPRWDPVSSWGRKRPGYLEPW